jgi:hypothetical protein
MHMEKFYKSVLEPMQQLAMAEFNYPYLVRYSLVLQHVDIRSEPAMVAV